MSLSLVENHEAPAEHACLNMPPSKRSETRKDISDSRFECVIMRFHSTTTHSTFTHSPKSSADGHLVTSLSPQARPTQHHLTHSARPLPSLSPTPAPTLLTDSPKSACGPLSHRIAPTPACPTLPHPSHPAPPRPDPPISTRPLTIALEVPVRVVLVPALLVVPDGVDVPGVGVRHQIVRAAELTVVRAL